MGVLNDALSYAADYVGDCEVGAAVDIYSQATGQSGYKAPKDGYITFQNYQSASGTASIYIDGVETEFITAQNLSGYGKTALFVKRGSVIKLTNSFGNLQFNYRPVNFGGGVVTYLLTRLTRLTERRWRHESGVDRQGTKLPCRQLQLGTETRERHSYNGRWRLYRHRRSRRDSYTNSCNSERWQNGTNRRDYNRQCGRLVYSRARKGYACTLQKYVGELVHGLSAIDVTPERGCAA